MRLKTQERERGQNLAKTVVEGKSFDAKLFHSLQLLLVEILQLIPDDRHEEISSISGDYVGHSHGEKAISIEVHAAEPVLDCSGMSFVLEKYFYRS